MADQTEVLQDDGEEVWDWANAAAQAAEASHHQAEINALEAAQRAAEVAAVREGKPRPPPLVVPKVDTPIVPLGAARAAAVAAKAAQGVRRGQHNLLAAAQGAAEWWTRFTCEWEFHIAAPVQLAPEVAALARDAAVAMQTAKSLGEGEAAKIALQQAAALAERASRPPGGVILRFDPRAPPRDRLGKPILEVPLAPVDSRMVLEQDDGGPGAEGSDSDDDGKPVGPQFFHWSGIVHVSGLWIWQQLTRRKEFGIAYTYGTSPMQDGGPRRTEELPRESQWRVVRVTEAAGSTRWDGFARMGDIDPKLTWKEELAGTIRAYLDFTWERVRTLGASQVMQQANRVLAVASSLQDMRCLSGRGKSEPLIRRDAAVVVNGALIRGWMRERLRKNNPKDPHATAPAELLLLAVVVDERNLLATSWHMWAETRIAERGVRGFVRRMDLGTPGALDSVESAARGMRLPPNIADDVIAMMNEACLRGQRFKTRPLWLRCLPIIASSHPTLLGIKIKVDRKKDDDEEAAELDMAVRIRLDDARSGLASAVVAETTAWPPWARERKGVARLALAGCDMHSWGAIAAAVKPSASDMAWAIAEHLNDAHHDAPWRAKERRLIVEAAKAGLKRDRGPGLAGEEAEQAAVAHVVMLTAVKEAGQVWLATAGRRPWWASGEKGKTSHQQQGWTTVGSSGAYYSSYWEDRPSKRDTVAEVARLLCTLERTLSPARGGGRGSPKLLRSAAEICAETLHKWLRGLPAEVKVQEIRSTLELAALAIELRDDDGQIHTTKQDVWGGSMLALFRGHLASIGHAAIVEAFGVLSGGLEGIAANLLEERTESAVEELAKSRAGRWVGRLGDNARLLSRVIATAVPMNTTEDDGALLEHMLEWSLWPRYMEIGVGSLSGDARHRVKAAQSRAQRLMDALTSRNVTPTTLRIVWPARDRAARLIRLALHDDEKGKVEEAGDDEAKPELDPKLAEEESAIVCVMEERWKELDMVEHQRSSLQHAAHLWRLAIHPEEAPPIAIQDLDNALRQDLGNEPLCTLLEPNGRVVAFPCPPSLEEALPQLVKCHHLARFREAWRRASASVQHTPVTSDELIKEIWVPAHEEWSALCVRVRDGSATLREMEELLGDAVSAPIGHGISPEVLTHLTALATSCPQVAGEGIPAWIEQRASQVADYRQVRHAAAAAETVQALAESLGCTIQEDGDLSDQLVELAAAGGDSFWDAPLGSISSEAGSVGRLLAGMSSTTLLALAALTLSERLVTWLRGIRDEHRQAAGEQGGREGEDQQFAAFIRLCTQGVERADEVDHVRHLDQVRHSVVGVLELEGECSLSDILKTCLAVDGRDNLAAKIEESSRRVEWLRALHGRVSGRAAVTTMMELEWIASGTFEISVHDARGGEFQVESPEEVNEGGMRIVIQAVHEHGTPTHAELIELRSRLMLVATDEARVAVNSFVSSLRAVERATVALRALLVEGADDPNAAGRAGLGSIRLPVTGTAWEEESTRLEQAVSSWRDALAQARRKYPSLCHFTARQIHCLRHALESARTTGGHPSEEECANIRSLFRCITPNPPMVAEAAAAAMWSSDTSGRVFLEQLGEYAEALQAEWNRKQDKSAPPPSRFRERMTQRLRGKVPSLKEKPTSIGPRFGDVGMEQGAPNVVCARRGKALRMALSIILGSGAHVMGGDQWLLCTQSTTAEEVELVIRRCAYLGKPSNDGEHKMYLLTHVGRLSFSVQSKAVRNIQDVCEELGGWPKYATLIVVSDDPGAHMVTSLAAHARPSPPVLGDEIIQRHLQREYQRACHGDGDAHVEVIYADRSGMGRTLYCNRRAATQGGAATIPLQGQVNAAEVWCELAALRRGGEDDDGDVPRPLVVRFDVGPNACGFLDSVMLGLLFHRRLMDPDTHRVWHAHPKDRFFIDLAAEQTFQPAAALFRWLPRTRVLSPAEVLAMGGGDRDLSCLGVGRFDPDAWSSESWQRVSYFLRSRHDNDALRAALFMEFGEIFGGDHMVPPADCITAMLATVSMEASWTELASFVDFMNPLLVKLAFNDFIRAAGDFLPGLLEFVMGALVRMSRDFAVRWIGLASAEEQAAAINAGDDGDGGAMDAEEGEGEVKEEDVEDMDADFSASEEEDEKAPEQPRPPPPPPPIPQQGLLAAIRQRQQQRRARAPVAGGEAPQEGGEAPQEEEEGEEHQGEGWAMLRRYEEQRRRWEHDLHPYIFYGEGSSLVFFRFSVDAQGRMILPANDREARAALEAAGQPPEQIMTAELRQALVQNRAIREDGRYQQQTYEEQIHELGIVMEQMWAQQDGFAWQGPDPSYVLTHDSARHILAIHLRFESGLPCVIMGETGCGKTRLVRFMAQLYLMPGEPPDTAFRMLRIHGGITRADIRAAALDVVRLASQTGRRIVFFLDEMNTTDAADILKSLICDRMLDGKSLDVRPPMGWGAENLRMIAAVNPYRMHTAEAVAAMRASGLGFFHSDDRRRLGGVPLRNLVYRVHPLPKAVEERVMDWGNLHPDTERAYIERLVENMLRGRADRGVGARARAAAAPSVAARPEYEPLEINDEAIGAFVNTLVATHAYMRTVREEASVVSLRDVERACAVFLYFHRRGPEEGMGRIEIPAPPQRGRRRAPHFQPKKRTTTTRADAHWEEVGNVPGCPNAHNEYHKCNQYCRERWGQAPVEEEEEMDEAEVQMGDIFAPEEQAPAEGLLADLAALPRLGLRALFGRALGGGPPPRALGGGAPPPPPPLPPPRRQRVPEGRGGLLDDIRRFREEGHQLQQSGRPITPPVGVEVSPGVGALFGDLFDEDGTAIAGGGGEEEAQDRVYYAGEHELRRCMILALGVCYEVKLRSRDAFCETVARSFRGAYRLAHGAREFRAVIRTHKHFYARQLRLPIADPVAINDSLSECVFLWMIAVSLRIPLFIVGKPGTGKSLAKALVDDNAQGPQSARPFFRLFHQLRQITFQCSPQTTAEQILDVFTRARRLQGAQWNVGTDAGDEIRAVVVADELGLAEDSTAMPLKVLHNLLDDETGGGVAFCGISNWALDPAKMNRGIYVNLIPPGPDELSVTLRGIVEASPATAPRLEPYVQGFVQAHARVSRAHRGRWEEYHSPRDLFWLVKLIQRHLAVRPGRLLDAHLLEYAVRRNYDGSGRLRTDRIVRWFIKACNPPQAAEDAMEDAWTDFSPLGLVRACLRQGAHLTSKDKGEEEVAGVDGRYLLVLTHNRAALNILFSRGVLGPDTVVLFGSPFPQDSGYDRVCATIRKLRDCMEQGRTVVLLHLPLVYESLYDLLNQFYTRYSGQRYVDLGLGSVIVKARVHPSFRLVLVAEERTQLKEFAPPLLSRLEPHSLASRDLMADNQAALLKQLEKWLQLWISPRGFSATMPAGHSEARSRRDAICGWSEDLLGSLVILRSQEEEEDEDAVFAQAVGALLQLSPPDAILRGLWSRVQDPAKWATMYFQSCPRGSLKALLDHKLTQKKGTSLLLHITTHDRLLPAPDIPSLLTLSEHGLESHRVSSCSLHAFRSHDEFELLIRTWLQHGVTKVMSNTNSKEPALLLIQGDLSRSSPDLLAYAQYIIQQEATVQDGGLRHIVLLARLPVGGTNGFSVRFDPQWDMVHVDALLPDHPSEMPDIESLVRNDGSAVPLGDLLRGYPWPATVKSLLEPAFSVDPKSKRDGEAEFVPAEEEPATTMPAPMVSLSILRVLEACYRDVIARLVPSVTKGAGNDASAQFIAYHIRALTDMFHAVAQMQPTSPEHDPTGGTLGQQAFASALGDAVLESLRRREEIESRMHRPPWTSRAAQDPVARRRGGTFRNTLFLAVRDAVESALGEVLSSMVRDENVRLMDPHQPSCVRRLWLRTSSRPKLWLKPLKLNHGMAWRVATAGAGESAYRSQCPFSWVISEAAERLKERAEAQAAQSGTSVARCLARLLRTTDAGDLLAKETDPSAVAELAGRYASDLAATIEADPTRRAYSCAILRAASSTIPQTPGLSSPGVVGGNAYDMQDPASTADAPGPAPLVSAIARLHVALWAQRPRLLALSAVCAALPPTSDLAQRLRHGCEQGRSLSYLDALALHAAAEALLGHQQTMAEWMDWNDDDARAAWLRRALALRPGTAALLALRREGLRAVQLGAVGPQTPSPGTGTWGGGEDPLSPQVEGPLLTVHRAPDASAPLWAHGWSCWRRAESMRVFAEHLLPPGGWNGGGGASVSAFPSTPSIGDIASSPTSPMVGSPSPLGGKGTLPPLGGRAQQYCQRLEALAASCDVQGSPGFGSETFVGGVLAMLEDIVNESCKNQFGVRMVCSCGSLARDPVTVIGCHHTVCRAHIQDQKCPICGIPMGKINAGKERQASAVAARRLARARETAVRCRALLGELLSRFVFGLKKSAEDMATAIAAEEEEDGKAPMDVPKPDISDPLMVSATVRSPSSEALNLLVRVARGEHAVSKELNGSNWAVARSIVSLLVAAGPTGQPYVVSMLERPRPWYLGVLYIQAMEDALAERSSGGRAVRIQTATACLRAALSLAESATADADRLRAIAGARFGLHVASIEIIERYDRDRAASASGSVLEEDMASETLLEAVRALVERTTLLGAPKPESEEEDEKWMEGPALYVLKHIVRGRGLPFLRAMTSRITSSKNLRAMEWLPEVVGEAPEGGEGVDPFTACQAAGDRFGGGDYIRARAAVLEAVEGGRRGADARRGWSVMFGKSSSTAVALGLALHSVWVPRAMAGVVAQEEALDAEQHALRTMEALRCKNALVFVRALTRGKLDQGVVERPLLVEQRDEDDLYATTYAAALAAGKGHAKAAAEAAAVSDRHLLAGIVVHTAMTVLCGDKELFGPFAALVAEPLQLQGSFLPGMPNDEYARLIQSGARWYQCPNRHPYAVGDCGNVTTQGRAICLYKVGGKECGCKIGGKEYGVPFEGNKDVDAKDFTEHGHCLGPPDRREPDLRAHRHQGPETVAMLRLLVDACLRAYCGVAEDGGAALVNRILRQDAVGRDLTAFAFGGKKPDPLAPNQVAAFLEAHLRADLKELAFALHRSQEDTALLVHVMLTRMASVHAGGSRGIITTAWKTTADRDKWEAEFADAVFAPIFRSVDRLTDAAVRAVAVDMAGERGGLARRLGEAGGGGGDLAPKDDGSQRKEEWNAVWRYRRRANVEHCVRAFERLRAHSHATERAAASAVDVLTASSGSGTKVGEPSELTKAAEEAAAAASVERQYPVVALFMRYRVPLGILRHVPAAVMWQHQLLTAFADADRSTVATLTIASACAQRPIARERRAWKTGAAAWFKVWNDARTLIDRVVGGVALTDQERRVVLSMDSPLESVLPSPRGPGRGALTVLPWLIYINNTFADAVDRIRGADPLTAPRIPMLGAAPEQLCSYSESLQLLPAVLAASRQSLQYGAGGSISYDWSALERFLLDTVAGGRPRIDCSVRAVAYAGEAVGDTSPAERVRARLEQEPLPRAFRSRLAKTLDDPSAFPDALAGAAAALRQVDTAIAALQHVAVGVGREQERLVEYLTSTLLIPKERLPAPLGDVWFMETVCISHILALRSALDLHAAVALLRAGADPFAGIGPAYRAPLPSGAVRELEALAAKNDLAESVLSLLRDEMRRRMVPPENAAPGTGQAVLGDDGRVPDMNPDWPLSTVVEIWLDDDGDIEVEDVVPEEPELLVKHAIAVWNALALASRGK